MGLHHVPYDLEQWKGILASSCRLFTSKDISYVPIGVIVRERGMDALLFLIMDILEKFINQRVNELLDMPKKRLD